EFDPAVEALLHMLEDYEGRIKQATGALVLMGFSQGAALAFAAATREELEPTAIVSLAGFLPEGEYLDLNGVPVYWGHGVRDQLVPVEMAREGVARLERFGADVQYCEADVAHKIGLECARGLKLWLTRRLAPLGS
ncbi:MAG: hypothetical protein GTO14_25830, partial [Anaerolineales bacterium]|nr:hypothetical protein [Anaerolineales bacterium]